MKRRKDTPLINRSELGRKTGIASSRIRESKLDEEDRQKAIPVIEEGIKALLCERYKLVKAF